MKKQYYIQPQTSVVFLQSVTMLAASNEFNGDSVNLNPDDMGEGDGSDAGSRRHRRNAWDEEEEDW